MDIQTTRLQRLTLLLETKYGNRKTELAKALDIAPSYLSRLYTEESENRRSIGHRMARRIEDASGKPRGWLDTPINVEVDTSEGSVEAEYRSGPYLSRIPVVGELYSTNGGIQMSITQYDEPTESLTTPSTDVDAYSIRVRGDGLMPRILEGDALAINPNEDCQPGDYVYVRTTDGQCYLRELLSFRPHDVLLNSITTGVSRVALERNKIACIDKVTAIIPGNMFTSQ